MTKLGFVPALNLNHEKRSEIILNLLAFVGAIACCCFTAVNSASAQTLNFMATLYGGASTNFGDLSPSCVAAVDVNGDGKPDLICANGSVNTLTVLTNDGIGYFGSNATLNLASAADWVVAADVNGDGKPDLICADGNSPGTLTVLTNNGAGGFGFNATLAVGFGPMRVVAADVNGDGKVDLISADLYGKTLTVLTNNGSGVFSSNATLNVGAYPLAVIAADLNGDGKVDLICADGYTNTLTVFTNNGSGVFGFNATLAVGDEPMSVAAADLNGDGKLDLITANYGAASGNTLTVLTNNGSGFFGSNATLIVGTGPDCVIAADVNGDGAPDLISANSQDDSLTVLTNNGSGIFTCNTTLAVNDYPVCVVAADVNGDGKLDLISADHFAGLTVLTQIGFTSWTYALSNTCHSVVVMDVNNDGKPDVVTANLNAVVNNMGGSTGDTLTVLTNTGAGHFGYYATLGVGSAPVFLVAADLNGDGFLDLISANDGGDGSLSILTNNAQGGFGAAETISLAGFADADGDPTCIAPVVVNSGGKVDLAVPADGYLQLFTNNGSGFLASNAVLSVGNDPYYVVAADVNGDGKMDLIGANELNSRQSDPAGTLLVLINDGNGGFVSNATYEVGIDPQCFVAADVNGDGKVDLITANFGSDTLSVLTNNGSGGFGSNATYQVGIQPLCVVASDINGDGWPDLITANFGSATGNSLTVLTNNGSGGFGFYATIGVDEVPNCVVAADVNGDGKPDLIVASSDGTLTVLINTITFPTPPNMKPPNLSLALSDPNIVISWTSSATNFAIQTNSSLSGGNWGTASYAISTVNGTNQSITIPPPPGTLFFRLVHP
jgi:hypothetical protein